MKKNAPSHGRQFAATAFFEQKSSIFHPANPGAGKIRMKIRIHTTRQCHSAFISESTRRAIPCVFRQSRLDSRIA
ncbi:hypothetical protein [Burkholderia gladioli]|uniref:hypothetical protein n=1 Tax=Burkholderia gladioli TaxID=28095 RepID=UPI00163E214D|nr:hypothetical protein [Burkholderia gladioli]